MIVLYVIRAKLRIVFDISSFKEEFSHLLSLSGEKKGARGRDKTDGRARHRVPVAGKTPCGVRKSTFRKALEYSAESTRILCAKYGDGPRTTRRKKAARATAHGGMRERPSRKGNACGPHDRVCAINADIFPIPGCPPRAARRPAGPHPTAEGKCRQGAPATGLSAGRHDGTASAPERTTTGKWPEATRQKARAGATGKRRTGHGAGGAPAGA